MHDNDDIDALLAEFRRLAVHDPRGARERFCTLLAGDPLVLEGLLTKLDAPGDGRLRQLIANAVRTRPDKEKVLPYLRSWHAMETDEFAKRAISAAISGSHAASPAHAPAREPELIHQELIDAYRYAAGRLQHKLRNAFMGPSGNLIRLECLASKIEDAGIGAELSSIAADLQKGITTISRIMEFNENDAYFLQRSISICEWLEGMNTEYARRYQPVMLSFTGRTTMPSTRLRANDYLLETIFWNIWVNAQQAVEGQCRIDLHLSTAGAYLQMVICDNGPGFSSAAIDSVFQDQYSTKQGGNRGRGLLEVADAVQKLHGSIRLIRHADGTHRLSIRFPLEDS